MRWINFPFGRSFRAVFKRPLSFRCIKRKNFLLFILVIVWRNMEKNKIFSASLLEGATNNLLRRFGNLFLRLSRISCFSLVKFPTCAEFSFSLHPFAANESEIFFLLWDLWFRWYRFLSYRFLMLIKARHNWYEITISSCTKKISFCLLTL